jgi:hypothetical protein
MGGARPHGLLWRSCCASVLLVGQLAQSLDAQGVCCGPPKVCTGAAFQGVSERQLFFVHPVVLGLGRIVALCYRSSTLYQIH